jgi:hypothetical protein
MEARVFHDMEGEMWVDCKQQRLAAFNGHLTRDVKFGLGLLGHLDKGGHFEVRQAEVVPGHWDLTNMSVEITGKALLFATIGMRKKENHGAPDCGGVALHPPAVGGKSGEVSCRFRLSKRCKQNANVSRSEQISVFVSFTMRWRK